MNEPLAAYHNDHTTKAKYVNRLKDHMAADELVRGIGWDYIQHRGCAIGCTLEAYGHTLFPIELGMPVWLAYLCDFLHENTSKHVWPTFQLHVLEAIPIGFSDWAGVRKDVILVCLEVARLHADIKGEAAIDHVAACWRGERADWSIASAAANEAADSATWTTAATAADVAAYAATYGAAAASHAPNTIDDIARAAVIADKYSIGGGMYTADRIAEELLESIKRHSK